MKQDINGIIRQIAKQEGVSEQEVLDEMQKAIDAGYNNPDPAVQAYWASTPFSGQPSPQELIAFLAGKLKNETLH